jgi:hypothetical protein
MFDPVSDDRVFSWAGFLSLGLSRHGAEGERVRFIYSLYSEFAAALVAREHWSLEKINDSER